MSAVAGTGFNDGCFMAESGSAWKAKTLLLADAACDAAASYNIRSAHAQIHVRHPEAVRLAIRLPHAPRAVVASPPDRPGSAKPIDFTWRESMVEVELDDAGESVLWIDPVTDLAALPRPLRMKLNDGAGEHSQILEAAVADDGDTIAFAEISPREPGIYEFIAEDAELLVQDRWDPDLSARGQGRVTACLREGTEIFVRYRARPSTEFPGIPG